MDKDFFKNGELDENSFNDLIRYFDMKCYYETRDTKRRGKIIVEKWSSSTNPLIKMVREYNFNKKNVKKIDEDRRIIFLEKILHQEVDVENYEEAAKIRDIITYYSK